MSVCVKPGQLARLCTSHLARNAHLPSESPSRAPHTNPKRQRGSESRPRLRFGLVLAGAQRRLALAIFCLLTAPAAAAAAAPDLKYLFPAGAARGATVQVTAGGNPGGWPAQVWVSRPGVQVAAAEEQGKFSVTAAADAPPGVYWLRIYNAEGAAAPLPFIVGTLSETNEQEPNDSPAKPQSLDAQNCTVNGRLEKRGDVDVFTVSLTKGQTLVASVAAHETLGSPMDAVLQIISPRGTVLAQSDDERGLDPLLTFAAPADGAYRVRVFAFPAAPDASISLAGGEAFVYRLTVTTGGFLDAAMPLAVARPATTVEAFGWNLPAAEKQLDLAPSADQASLELFSPHWAGSLSLPVVDTPAPCEAEPNDLAHPQTIGLPANVSGRIAADGDCDAFRVHLAKATAWRFKVESRSLGYPLDSVLKLVDASGKTLATSDDTGRNNVDAELNFTAPADGDYTLAVSDLYRHGGARYFYRLSLEPLEPDFSFGVAQHAFTLTADKPLELPVTVDRRQNFSGEIEIAVVGLPDGVTCSPVRSTAQGETAKTVKLTLAGSAAFSGPIRVAGAATEPGSRRRFAKATLAAGARTSDLWLTVRPLPPH